MKEVPAVVRFVHFFNYAKGVSIEDGEKWYLGKHVPQAKKLPGVVRYISWRGIAVDPKVNPALPTPANQFVRRSELWFENLQTCRQALIANPELWTPSKEGVPGFREFECMLLDEEPQYNLLRHTPPQHYKYITLQLNWTGGRPRIEEPEEIFIDTYFLFYRPDISTADGEDWYLGHHTREGKQAPGMKHYKTWKAIKVPSDPGSPLRLNKWFRLTELGGTDDMFYELMVNPKTRIRFTPSPLGNVIGGWGNIFIKLDDVEELL
jgi:hypothetical protein